MLCSSVRSSIFATVLLGICTISVNSQSAPKIKVDAKEKILKEGEQFEFICRVGRPIETCVIEFSNQNNYIKMQVNIKKDDYEYIGRGYQRGDCGIRYFAIKPDQNGNVTCTVGFPDLDVESSGSTNLIVAIAPTAINLESRNEFRDGEEMRISCTATGGRPASSVSILLDNNILATSSESQDTVYFVTVASFKDNNKKLVCRATHQALDEPKVTEKTLKVLFKPQPINQFGAAIQRFGFIAGMDGIICVQVFANPKPRFEWKINGEYPDRVRYNPVDHHRIKQNEATGAWMAELLILPVYQEDYNKNFTLTASNEFGKEVFNIYILFDPLDEYEYDVSLNSQSAPKLNVDTKEEIVKEGEQFELICRAGRPIETCRIKFSNMNGGIKMRENDKKNNYEYLGEGFQRGDCGIRYFAVKSDQHGNVTCTVGFPELYVESIGSTNLIVAIAPTALNMSVKNEFMEGEEMHICCTATGGRPATSISLLLDNNTLATNSETQDTVNFVRKASFKDNNKKLVCRATHQALDEPKVTEKTLQILFKPQPINQFGEVIQQFGFLEGRYGIIAVDVFANPEPRFQWKINGEYPDRARYTPVNNQRIIQNEETGAWMADLLITPVNQEDYNNNFTLIAINAVGYEVYKIKIFSYED